MFSINCNVSTRCDNFCGCGREWIKTLRVQSGVEHACCGAVMVRNLAVAGLRKSHTWNLVGIMVERSDFLMKIAKLLNSNNPFHSSAVWIGWVNARFSYVKARVFLQSYAECTLCSLRIFTLPNCLHQL